MLLDLGEAHVGDATGFGFIVECQRRARRAGRPMRIVAADERTRRLLRRARLHSLLSTAPAATTSEPAAGRRRRLSLRLTRSPATTARRATGVGTLTVRGRYPRHAPRLAFTACPRAPTPPAPSATAPG